MASPSRLAAALQRLVLATARLPGAERAWGAAYRWAARAWGAVLAGGREASVYARGGLASGEIAPGLSDLDLVVVAPRGEDAEALRRRWLSLRRNRVLAALVDWPRIHDAGELRGLVGSTTLTHGLGTTAPAAVYFGRRATLDGIRALEHPGLCGVGSDWRLIAGPERRPAAPGPAGGGADPVAAWLELLYWWRWLALLVRMPDTPRAADVCVKLVAEPARIWLSLARGHRAPDRRAALLAVRGKLPSAALAIDAALALLRRPGSRAEPTEILPGAVGLSALVGAEIEGRLADAGTVAVRLDGAPGSRPPDRPDALPLADWRSLVCPPRAEESFAVVPGALSDPRAVRETLGPAGGRAAAMPDGALRVLRERGLIGLPCASLLGSRMRSLKARFSDPVSFALIDGRSQAAFPAAPGWSAQSWAARAVAEHTALIAASDGGPAAERIGGLLTAARAGLLQESLEEGEPALAVTLDALASRLAERPGGSAAAEAVAARTALLEGRRTPDARVLEGLEDLVTGMRAYRRGC